MEQSGLAIKKYKYISEKLKIFFNLNIVNYFINVFGF